MLPRPGELDLLHASPPCQDLSPLNQHTDFDRASQNLFPLLDAVRAILLRLMPYFDPLRCGHDCEAVLL